MKIAGISIVSIAVFTAIFFAVASEDGADTSSSKEKITAMVRFIDHQARGFKAVLDKDVKVAEEHFTEAGEVASENENFEGVLESGYSLSTIGKTESAKKFFGIAKDMVSNAEDWRAMLAVGYAYASLPEEEEAEEDAMEVMEEAAVIAENVGNWRGLIEVGNGLKQLKNTDLAKATYDKALHLLETVRDSEGLEMLATSFRDIGDKEKATEVAFLAEEVKKEEAQANDGKKIRKRREIVQPPKDWSPTGKSLAEPPEISDASRAILAGKAQSKLMEAHEKALLEAEADHKYSYELKKYHFNDPGFKYRRWDIKGDFDVRGWAENEMGRYRMKDGLYILVD